MDEKPIGIRCPHCHCPHAPTVGKKVFRTRKRTDCIQRTHECRHCGKRFTTTERVDGVAARP